jgi:hypothetical protein
LSTGEENAVWYFGTLLCKGHSANTFLYNQVCRALLSVNTKSFVQFLNVAILIVDPFELLLTRTFVGFLSTVLCLCFGVGEAMEVAFKLFSV